MLVAFRWLQPRTRRDAEGEKSDAAMQQRKGTRYFFSFAKVVRLFEKLNVFEMSRFGCLDLH